MALKRVLAFLLLCVAILSNFTMLRASTLDNLNNQREDQKKQIEAYNEELKKVETEEALLIVEINELNANIEGVQNNIDDLSQQVEDKLEEISVAESQLGVAIDEEKAQYATMKSRIRDMYENSRQSYLEILFEADSIADFYKRYEYMKAVMEYDQNMFKNLEQTRLDIEDIEAKLHQERVVLENSKEELTLQVTTLEENRILKTSKVNTLQEKQVQIQDEKEHMEDGIKEIDAKIKAEEARLAALKYSGGQMAWPIPGYYRLSSDFGWRNDPFTGERWFHYGIDIPAPKGTKVIAAASGEVIHSGWINGYGYTIMIGHGSGIVTLYGHNSGLAVSKGDWVEKGDTIAYVGSTGRSTGNHSHFEVRVNGEHKDPKTYVMSN